MLEGKIVFLMFSALCICDIFRGAYWGTKGKDIITFVEYSPNTALCP